jgi:hypothetical protein
MEQISGSSTQASIGSSILLLLNLRFNSSGERWMEIADLESVFERTLLTLDKH